MEQPHIESGQDVTTQLAPGEVEFHAKSQTKNKKHDVDGSSTWAASAQSLTATIVVALFIVTFLLQTFQIPTPSMENTLLVGDFLLVDKVVYGASNHNPLLPYHELERNAIVVFFWPVDPRQRFVKRVIGLPGDRVRLQSGRVFVNGTQIPEPFAYYQQLGIEHFHTYRDNFPNGGPMDTQVTAAWAADLKKLVRHGELLVPEGHYFVMGDNRNDSLDSRYWGLVPRESVIGRPLLIYWSLRGWGEGGNSALARGERKNENDKIEGESSIATRVTHLVRWERTLHLVP